jgi:hypothetical protein
MIPRFQAFQFGSEVQVESRSLEIAKHNGKLSRPESFRVTTPVSSSEIVPLGLQRFSTENAGLAPQASVLRKSLTRFLASKATAAARAAMDSPAMI